MFYGIKIRGLMLTFVAIEAVPALPGATKVCHKVDFESFSMQMHVPFLLNPIVKYSCVVILVVVQK
jgi:hypothetical protein